MEQAAAAGIASSVLTVVGLLLLSQLPGLKLGDAALTAWFDDGGNRTVLILAQNLLSIAAVAFLWFVAVIRRRLD